MQHSSLGEQQKLLLKNPAYFSRINKLSRPRSNRKREIIQATIGGEAEFAAALNWEEIQELLA